MSVLFSARAGVALALVPLGLFLFPFSAAGQALTAHWDFSPATDQVVSCEACVGTQSLTCDDVRWTVPAMQNWFTFTATPGVLHLVTVRAVNGHGPGPFASEIGVSIPLLSPIADRSDGVGAPVAIDPVVTDPDGSSLSFSANDLPPGLTLDAGSGRISGALAAVGTYRPTVTVRDANGSDAHSFAWTITTSGTDGGGGTSPMPGAALSFPPTTPQAVGTAVALSASGQGGSGTPMYRFWVQPWGGSWQIVQDWSFSATHTWRPAAPGGYNLTVYGRTGSSGDGDVSASKTFVARD